MMVLGISLGTATSGVAVLSGNELIFWHTHSFREPWSDEKAGRIAACYERYLIQYRPAAVIVKIPPRHHHSPAITRLISEVKALFQFHGCMAEFKTKREVKAIVPGVHNHQQLMQYIAGRYPILLPEYERALAGKQRYHAKLFDAVITAYSHRVREM